MSRKNFKAQGMSIEGLEELTENLSKVMPREAKNLARSTVHTVAGKLRNSMRQKAPKDEGTLRKAITTKRRRGTPTQVQSDVIITHGKGQKHEAWYWHFVEFGTQRTTAKPFINPAIEEMLPQMPEIYKQEWWKKLEKLLVKKAKKAEKK